MSGEDYREQIWLPWPADLGAREDIPLDKEEVSDPDDDISTKTRAVLGQHARSGLPRGRHRAVQRGLIDASDRSVTGRAGKAGAFGGRNSQYGGLI